MEDERMSTAKRGKKTSEKTKGKEEKPHDYFATIVADVKEKLKKAKGKIAGAVEDAHLAEHLRDAIDSICSCVRGNVIMVRVDDDTVKRLNELVDAGLFKSKSDSAAFLIMEGIKAQKAVFDKISKKAAEISELRKELKKMIGLE